MQLRRVHGSDPSSDDETSDVVIHIVVLMSVIVKYINPSALAVERSSLRFGTAKALEKFVCNMYDAEHTKP